MDNWLDIIKTECENVNICFYKKILKVIVPKLHQSLWLQDDKVMVEDLKVSR